VPEVSRQTESTHSTVPVVSTSMRDLAAEGILILAGGRSILLQLAYPAIGHGVAAHSDFQRQPIKRLKATLTYVYAVTSGTPEQAAEAVRRVNLAHIPVHGQAGADSPGYNAFTPELQLWVAATLYDSATRLHAHVFGSLSAKEDEAIYRQYAVLGTALQVPAELWPVNREAFATYWQEQVAALSTDSATRDVARQLLYPRTGPLWLRLAMPVGRLATTGLLPVSVRALFDLPWTPRDQRKFDLLLRFLSAVYPRLPRLVRHWPRNYFLGQFARAVR
jgi:uncharacterized protein (DUF2236 family)